MTPDEQTKMTTSAPARNNHGGRSAAPAMDTEKALQAARDTHQSILVTLRSDGKPQLSNVLHTVGDDGVVRISTTTDRAKYSNLRRTPWAALHVNGPTFWATPSSRAT